MILAPVLSATIGRLRYDTHAAACHATLACLPRGSSAVLHLPPGVRFDAAPGDDATLEASGGEGSRTLLTGRVHGVRRTFDALVVTIADAGAALGALRPSATYERQKAAQIVRALAEGAGVTTGRVDLDLECPAYVAHPQRTASEHIAELARLGGAVARTDARGRLDVTARPQGRPTMALRYGRELTHYQVHREAVVNPQRFAIGFGPAGSVSAPDALRHSTGVLPSSAPDGGAGVRRHAVPVLRTPAAARAASEALQVAAAARGDRLVASGFLLAALRPGDVIEVQDLPGDLRQGPWILTRVEHRLHGRAGGTTIEAESAEGTSLLGALLGAVGGVL